MPYDLYGQYYASERDAINAELAQMSEIDSRYHQKGINKNQSDIQIVCQYIKDLQGQIEVLSNRIAVLEGSNLVPNPNQ